ncbi:MAG: hypothetical protein GY747_04505 [Planctomycetes bacterium]|nr:hypothetical protein [Planctomycetota bacterium]MCP4771482.1 hypothetical protein [Planctomycetota bacterium]MCP4861143.1 hypothetical protein [Planctomycetota bacterium]
MRCLAFVPLTLFAALIPTSAPMLLDAVPVNMPHALNALDSVNAGWKYKKIEVEGWTVFVQKELYSKEELRTQVLDLLKIKLWEIATRLPKDAVEHLQTVELRMHLAHDKNEGAAYHPSAAWLRDNDMPEDWARGIEFGNAKNFLAWSQQQPAMVLHELAHAWHDRVLGWDHAEIKQVFQTVADAGTLEEVIYVSGGTQRAYGLNNQMEFFAEMSEAWWSTNDMYPFVRGELLQALPDVASKMDGWWQLPKKD